MAVNHYGYIRATGCGKSVSNLVFNGSQKLRVISGRRAVGSQPLRLYQGDGLWEVNHYGYIRATDCGKSTITVISGPRTVGSQPLRSYEGYGLWEVNHYGHMRGRGCGS